MPSSLHPGALDHRITIQRSTPSSNNNFNEPIDSWSNTATVWCKRHNTSADEAYRAQEVGAEITTRFTVRHSSITANTTPKDRIMFNGDTYNITAIRPLDRNHWIEIDAVRKADRNG